MDCLPILGLVKETGVGRHSHVGSEAQVRRGDEVQGGGDVRGGTRVRARRPRVVRYAHDRAKMAADLSRSRAGGPPEHGQKAGRLRLRDQGRRRQGGRRGGLAKGDAMRRFGVASQTPLDRWCRLYREGGAEALLPRPKGRPKAGGAAPRTREQELEERVRKLEAQVAHLKNPRPGLAGPALTRAKAEAVRELLPEGHLFADLLEAAALPRSTYFYSISHPARGTRPELLGRVAELFGSEANGMGHRQIAMRLRGEDGVEVADKTVLKMMHELGLSCGIRRETDYHRYNSYKGVVGETFENLVARDFRADGPWQKMGTDVTEFKLSFGKAYLAPVYDFGSKEIVAWSISDSPGMDQQREMLAMLAAAKPSWARPVLHSDMGWQYQHGDYVSALRDNGITQSMSRKGNCIDNGATEQVFGHLKDEFFRGRDWETYESFKADLEDYIWRWNNVRRQVGLKGLTPVEFWNQALEQVA